MTLLEHMFARRRSQISADEARTTAAMESLVEKRDPSFKIVTVLIGILILYAMGLPLTYAYAYAFAH
jgi:hypothetical protein